MKNKHPKRTLALKMMSNKEREDHVTPFQSKAWFTRKHWQPKVAKK